MYGPKVVGVKTKISNYYIKDQIHAPRQTKEKNHFCQPAVDG